MKKSVILYVFFTAFLFGTMEVTLKIAGGELDSLQLTFLRFIVGGIFLAPFAFKEAKNNKTRISINDFFWLLFLGILCVPLSMLLFQLGIMNSNASTAAVLMSINPLFTMIFAFYILKEKISARKIIALIIGAVGIFFMIRPWDIQQGNTFLGAGLMLLAAMIFGVYTVVGKIRIEKIGIITQTSLSFIFGSLVLLIIMMIMGIPIIKGVMDNILVVLYIGVFVTGFGYYFYFMAVKQADATTASIAFFIKPAIAPIFAVLILKDVLLWNTYLGIFLILAASAISLIGGMKWKKIGNKNEKNNIQ